MADGFFNAIIKIRQDQLWQPTEIQSDYQSDVLEISRNNNVGMGFRLRRVIRRLKTTCLLAVIGVDNNALTGKCGDGS